MYHKSTFGMKGYGKGGNRWSLGVGITIGGTCIDAIASPTRVT